MAYVVIGLGRTGLACVRFLLRRGEEVIVADTREKPPNLKIFQQKFANIPLHTGGLPYEAMLKAQAVIVPPGLSLDDPIFDKLKQASIPVWGDIELFAQSTELPIVAITGSNGKSTVTSLVGAMAKRCHKNMLVGGNIGVPALDLLEAKPEAFVLELSSFQLETTFSLKPKVACILNISPDHLDRHGNFEAYVEAKQSIYHQAQTAIYNRHDDNTRPRAAVEQSTTFGFDAPKEGHFGLLQKDQTSWLAYGSTPLMSTDEIQLFGKHNQLNALTALSIGHACGFSMEAMLEELRAFQDLKHRCQVVAKMNQITWVNDTKGTNVGAAYAAIESVAQETSGKIILIAGGKAKDKDFHVLGPLVASHVKRVLLIGQDGPIVGSCLESFAPCEECGDLKVAIKRASELSQAGDTVLLSPACTSLDAYANFEERGEAFIQAVSEL